MRRLHRPPEWWTVFHAAARVRRVRLPFPESVAEEVESSTAAIPGSVKVSVLSDVFPGGPALQVNAYFPQEGWPRHRWFSLVIPVNWLDPEMAEVVTVMEP